MGRRTLTAMVGLLTIIAGVSAILAVVLLSRHGPAVEPGAPRTCASVCSVQLVPNAPPVAAAPAPMPEPPSAAASAHVRHAVSRRSLRPTTASIRSVHASISGQLVFEIRPLGDLVPEAQRIVAGVLRKLLPGNDLRGAGQLDQVPARRGP